MSSRPRRAGRSESSLSSRTLTQCSKSSCWKQARWRICLGSSAMGRTLTSSSPRLCTTITQRKHSASACSSRCPPHSPLFRIALRQFSKVPSSSSSRKGRKKASLRAMKLHASSRMKTCEVSLPSSWSAKERKKQLPSPATSLRESLRGAISLVKAAKYSQYSLVSLKTSPFAIFLRSFILVSLSRLRCARASYTNRCRSFFFPIILLLIIKLLLRLIILRTANRTQHSTQPHRILRARKCLCCRRAPSAEPERQCAAQLQLLVGMFILSNIKVSTSEALFSRESRKFLKFQINKSTKKHPFPSRFISSHEIQWDADLKFPQALYARPLAFEVFMRHEFGYHEEELTSLLQGEPRVERSAEVGSFELRRADDPRCAGYLSCRVRHVAETAEQVVETRIARKQLLTIRSIIAHLPQAVGKKVSCSFSVAGREARTSAIRTTCGDLVFTDRIVLQKTDLDRLGTLSVFEGEGVKLGEGRMSLEGARPEKKVALMSGEELLGEAYVDCTQEEKDGGEGIKSSSLPHYLRKLRPSAERAMKDSSSTGRPRFKKISVVSGNESIVFSTSQRFKQTNNPQFLGTRSSNRSRPSLREVRARRQVSRSGQKPLFPIEETPGVGRYKLPTIWDRY